MVKFVQNKLNCIMGGGGGGGGGGVTTKKIRNVL
jgi:hypothetical protein